MTKIPFENTAAGVLEPGNNFAAWIDRFITPGRLYQKTWDPEGFFSTIPAIATGITRELINISHAKDLKDKIILIYLVGSVALCLGMVWDFSIKNRNTVLDCLFCSDTLNGTDDDFFSLLFRNQDHKKFHSTRFGIVFGSNAIFAYVLHSILGRLFHLPIIEGKGIQQTWMKFSESTSIDPQLFSLAWALFYTFFIYIIII